MTSTVDDITFLQLYLKIQQKAYEHLKTTNDSNLSNALLTTSEEKRRKKEKRA